MITSPAPCTHVSPAEATLLVRRAQDPLRDGRCLHLRPELRDHSHSDSPAGLGGKALAEKLQDIVGDGSLRKTVGTLHPLLGS
jgi:hypothetical protein